MSEQTTPALDAPELSIGDYRAMREGRTVERVTVSNDGKISEAPPATPADAESGAGSEPANDTTEDDQTSDDGTEQPKQGEKKEAAGRKAGLVDEVIKLRRENRELKARTAPPAQEQRTPPQPAEAARAGNAAPAPAATQDLEPDPTKYTDYNAYNRDLVRWEVRESQRQAAAESKQRAQQETERQRFDTWQGRVRASMAEIPDFEAIAFKPDLPVTPVMGDAIQASDIGPKVLYHLGSHPEEAARIAKLSTVEQIREITKIELSLTPKADDAPAADEDEETPRPKQAISKAPAPIPRPAGSGAKSAPSGKSLEGMSQSEYRALRESGKLR